jgi:K+-sensing histidine kinase KdpD
MHHEYDARRLRQKTRKPGRPGFYLFPGLASLPPFSIRFSGDSLMRYRTGYLPKLQPWSPASFAAAIAAVVFAATVQEIAESFGITPYFAGFIPAILVVSLLGGAPAGVFAALLSIPVVWWAFMPPHFEFNALTAADYDSFAIFALLAALVICFSHLYREARVLMRK